MSAQFILVDAKPVLLDRDARSAVEKERLHEAQRRHDLFFAKLLRRDAGKVPPVRTV